MRTLAVRRINALEHARSLAVRRWQCAGHGAGLGKPDLQAGYLRFTADGKRGEWRGLIKARDWLHQSLPQLQSLLAIECPVTSIAGLFRAMPCPLVLEVDELQYRDLSGVELIDSTVLPMQDLPWLDTSRGRLWVTELPPECASNEALECALWLADLPLRLELLLGVSNIRRSSVLRLGQGDVLRITQLTHQCLLADRGIGVFTFIEEGLHMELTVADSSQQAAAEPGREVELDHLPVRLEFILATHDIPLGTLQKIIAGQLLPLAADAAQHIEVRANGKRVARGELVQLDEQLGVELLEVYRNVSDE